MLTHVKNYRSANLLVCNQFISDPYPWREQDWVELGVKGSFRAKQDRKRVAEDQSVKPLGSLMPGGQRPSGLGAKSTKSTKSTPSPK